MEARTPPAPPPPPPPPQQQQQQMKMPAYGSGFPHSQQAYIPPAAAELDVRTRLSEEDRSLYDYRNGDSRRNSRSTSRATALRTKKSAGGGGGGGGEGYGYAAPASEPPPAPQLAKSMPMPSSYPSSSSSAPAPLYAATELSATTGSAAYSNSYSAGANSAGGDSAGGFLSSVFKRMRNVFTGPSETEATPAPAKPPSKAAAPAPPLSKSKMAAPPASKPAPPLSKAAPPLSKAAPPPSKAAFSKKAAPPVEMPAASWSKPVPSSKSKKKVVAPSSSPFTKSASPPTRAKGAADELMIQSAPARTEYGGGSGGSGGSSPSASPIAKSKMGGKKKGKKAAATSAPSPPGMQKMRKTKKQAPSRAESSGSAEEGVEVEEMKEKSPTRTSLPPAAATASAAAAIPKTYSPPPPPLSGSDSGGEGNEENDGANNDTASAESGESPLLSRKLGVARGMRPRSLSTTSSSASLVLDDAEVSRLPPEIRRRGAEAIAAFQRGLVDGKRRSNRSKLMFIGESAAGKTTLLRALVSAAPVPEAPHDSTDLLDVGRWLPQAGQQPAEREVSGRFGKAAAAHVYQSLQQQEQQDAENSPVSSTPQAGGQGPGEAAAGAPDAARDNAARENAASNPAPTPAPAPVQQPDDAAPSPPPTPAQVEHDPLACQMPWDYLIKSAGGEGEDGLELATFDFGGQQEYRIFHPIYISTSGIYLYVVDLVELCAADAPGAAPELFEHQVAQAHFWLNSVHTHAPVAPVLVVGSKMCSLPCPTLAEQQAMADDALGRLMASFKSYSFEEQTVAVADPLAVDSCTGANIAKLRTLIEEIAQEEEGVTREIPIRWLSLEDTIMGLRATHDHMPLADVEEVALTRCGISKQDLPVVLQYLHDIGVFIHFRKPAVLASLVVINVSWLIGVMRAVITTPEKRQLRRQHWRAIQRLGEGLLDEDFAREVWRSLPDERGTSSLGSPDSHTFLLSLMKKFNLICPSPAAGAYMVPCLLPARVPGAAAASTANLLPAQRVFFDFGEFLPFAVFPQLLSLCAKHCQAHSQHNTLRRDAGFFLLTPSLSFTVVWHAAAHLIELRVADPAAGAASLPLVRGMLDSIVSNWLRNLVFTVGPGCSGCWPEAADSERLPRAVLNMDAPVLVCSQCLGQVADRSEALRFWQSAGHKPRAEHDVAADELGEQAGDDGSPSAFEYDAFLSYRRSDGEHLAGRIYDALVQRGLRVFFDRSSLTSGPFLESLDKGIRSSACFVPVVTPDYLGRRIAEPDDPCRLEVQSALAAGASIIPVVDEKFPTCFKVIAAMDSELKAVYGCLGEHDAVIISAAYFPASMDKAARHIRHGRRRARRASADANALAFQLQDLQGTTQA